MERVNLSPIQRVSTTFKDEIINKMFIFISFLFLSSSTYAQSMVPVAGFVTNQSGEPLAGVSI